MLGYKLGYENEVLVIKKKVKEEPIKEEPIKEPEINIEDAIEEIEIGVNKEALEEYKKVAEEIGFSPGALVNQKIRSFLKKRDRKIYNRNKVVEFLNSMYGERIKGDESTKPGWIWVPLIKNQKELSFGKTRHESGYGNNDLLYQNEIPFEVLTLARDLKKEIPEVSLYVSEVAVKKPDPFLLVSVVGMVGMVIAHWDEPTFKD